MDKDCCNAACCGPGFAPDETYRRVLWVSLGINLAMFGVEIVASFAASSMSLRADALDFLGDAANYAVALAVFGTALRWRASAALLKGSVMGVFGLWVAGSTIYYALVPTVPQAAIIGTVGVVAFAANAAVATMLWRFRGGDSQARSVWLCARNDCLVNLSVIAAGVGVWASGTRWPDIGVAAVIGYLGLASAVHIIRRAVGEMRADVAAQAAS